MKDNRRATAWLTLGDQPGTIQVWLAKPALRGGRWELPDGAPHLLLSGEGNVNAKWQVWSLEVALKEFRTLPETERELICIGGDAVLPPAPAPALAS